MATTTTSARKRLSALGHPGYGEAFARRVLATMERYGVSAHAAIFGGEEMRLAKFEAQEAGW